MTTVAPEDAYYEHDDHSVRTENVQEDEFINGHAHCRQLLTGQPSITLPVVEGEVLLGQWQKVMFVELDQARERRAFFPRPRDLIADLRPADRRPRTAGS